MSLFPARLLTFCEEAKRPGPVEMRNIRSDWVSAAVKRHRLSEGETLDHLPETEHAALWQMEELRRRCRWKEEMGNQPKALSPNPVSSVNRRKH
uniref:Uncharacterized protein n=1 Tax=Knipowitschia caucasica TaxID=637954 RepID=A0AAV2J980_KNICA